MSLLSLPVVSGAAIGAVATVGGFFDTTNLISDAGWSTDITQLAVSYGLVSALPAGAVAFLMGHPNPLLMAGGAGVLMAAMGYYQVDLKLSKYIIGNGEPLTQGGSKLMTDRFFTAALMGTGATLVTDFALRALV